MLGADNYTYNILTFIVTRDFDFELKSANLHFKLDYLSFQMLLKMRIVWVKYEIRITNYLKLVIFGQNISGDYTIQAK